MTNKKSLKRTGVFLSVLFGPMLSLMFSVVDLRDYKEMKKAPKNDNNRGRILLKKFS